MANPPPPYDNITGISRAVMKDNAQETIQNYNGVARPGELVVDMNTFDLYIGNTNGNINLVGGGSGNAGYPQSGGTVINITPPLPTGATYAASVTPLSVATTAYVSNKNVSNVRVTVAANCSVDLTLHRT